MKKLIFLFVVISAAVQFSSCGRDSKKVDYVFNSQGNPQIEAIERTDTYTKLFMFVDGIDYGYSFNMGKDAYLLADGIQYKVENAENIELDLDSNITVDKSCRYDFTMTFPPIPKDVDYFDFIEGDCSTCFKIYGITDRLDYSDKSYLSVIPENIRKADYSDAVVPEYDYEVGTTELVVHVVSPVKTDFIPQCSEEFLLRIFDALIPGRPMQEIIYKSKMDSTQTCHFSFEMAGTQCVVLNFYDYYVSFFVEPNKKNEVWIDSYAYGHKKPFLYTNGKLDALNRIESKRCFEYWDSDLTLGELAPEQFVDTLINKVKCIADSFNNDASVSKLEKAYQTWYAFYCAQESLDSYKFLRKDTANVISEADIMRFYESFIIDDNLFPYILHDEVVIETFNSNAEFVVTDTKKTQKLFIEFLSLTRALERNEWQNYSDSIADYIGDGCFHYAIGYYHKVFEDWVKMRYSSGCYIMQVPNVPNNELFNTIISNHKAKKLLITFWGVGCGPCQKEITEMEPLKTDDIEYVYISCPWWSPKERYDQQIKMIKGYHYYVTDEQWNYMLDSMNVRGIPYNICMKSDGTTITHKGFQSVEAIFDSFKE